jgi:hypothetical protein
MPGAYRVVKVRGRVSGAGFWGWVLAR